MSTSNVVTVQLGQCGNQVGSQLFSTLADEAAQAESSTLPEVCVHPPHISVRMFSLFRS